MTELQKYIEGVYKVHLANIDLLHGVALRRSVEPKRFVPYEPSNFIYSFFVFNALYDLDWAKSLERKDENDRTPHMAAGEETPKIKKFVEFFLSDLTCREKFVDGLSEELSTLDTGSTSVRDLLKSINVDKSIQYTYKFFRDVISQISENSSQIVKLFELEESFCFVYKVRCNIFHGRKTTIEMNEEGQARRIRIYATVLQQMNAFALINSEEMGLWKRTHQGDRSYLGSWPS